MVGSPSNAGGAGDRKMPARKRKGKPAGAASGVAATLFPFREDVPCLDMSEFRKSPGELIEESMRSADVREGKRARTKRRRGSSAR
jgi:hypothetical protein